VVIVGIIATGLSFSVLPVRRLDMTAHTTPHEEAEMIGRQMTLRMSRVLARTIAARVAAARERAMTQYLYRGRIG
jgi:hypothetical protein